MAIIEAFRPEFDVEMVTTRKVLERVPSDKGEWKPHPKSFSMAHLAQLVSRMPGWLTAQLRENTMDLGGFRGGYSTEKTETLVAEFDRLVKETRAALAKAKDSDLDVEWTLRNGDQVLLRMPTGAALRSTLNHLVHHRGQLTVYLRLVDVPVPSIYGPSADERM